MKSGRAKAAAWNSVPQHTVDAAQASFWSERWQKMERDADANIAAGRVAPFNSADDFLAELDQH